MSVECIILDFDGTFTDVEREAQPFLERYRQGLSEKLGGIDERWAEAAQVVQERPDEHGFRFGGRIVAPSHADPYILATSIAHLLLEDDRTLDDVAKGRLLEELFRTAYATCSTVFREDAQSTLDAVLEHDAPVFVVTNSHTDQVRQKLARLNGTEQIPVMGNARKFHLADPEPLDDRFRSVDEQIRIEGLDRPVYLRRGRYYEVLRKIWDDTKASPESTLVCGDIYELDLALPAQLGARVHLVARSRTPSYELAAVAGHGTHSYDLAGVLEQL